MRLTLIEKDVVELCAAFAYARSGTAEQRRISVSDAREIFIRSFSMSAQKFDDMLRYGGKKPEERWMSFDEYCGYCLRLMDKDDTYGDNDTDAVIAAASEGVFNQSMLRECMGKLFELMNFFDINDLRSRMERCGRPVVLSCLELVSSKEMDPRNQWNQMNSQKERERRMLNNNGSNSRSPTLRSMPSSLSLLSSPSRPSTAMSSESFSSFATAQLDRSSIDTPVRLSAPASFRPLLSRSGSKGSFILSGRETPNSNNITDVSISSPFAGSRDLFGLLPLSQQQQQQQQQKRQSSSLDLFANFNNTANGNNNVRATTPFFQDGPTALSTTPPSMKTAGRSPSSYNLLGSSPSGPPPSPALPSSMVIPCPERLVRWNTEMHLTAARGFKDESGGFGVTAAISRSSTPSASINAAMTEEDKKPKERRGAMQINLLREAIFGENSHDSSATGLETSEDGNDGAASIAPPAVSKVPRPSSSSALSRPHTADGSIVSTMPAIIKSKSRDKNDTRSSRPSTATSEKSMASSIKSLNSSNSGSSSSRKQQLTRRKETTSSPPPPSVAETKFESFWTSQHVDVYVFPGEEIAPTVLDLLPTVAKGRANKALATMWVEDMSAGLEGSRFVQVRAHHSSGAAANLGMAARQQNRGSIKSELRKVFAAYSKGEFMEYKDFKRLVHDCNLLKNGTFHARELDAVFAQMAGWGDLQDSYFATGGNARQVHIPAPDKKLTGISFLQWEKGLVSLGYKLFPHIETRDAAVHLVVYEYIFRFAKRPNPSPVFLHFVNSAATFVYQKFRQPLKQLFLHYARLEEFRNDQTGAVGATAKGDENDAELTTESWLEFLRNFDLLPNHISERSATLLFLDSRASKFIVGDARLSFVAFCEALGRLALVLFAPRRLALAVTGEQTSAFGPPCNASSEMQARTNGRQILKDFDTTAETVIFHSLFVERQSPPSVHEIDSPFKQERIAAPSALQRSSGWGQ